MGYYCSHHYAHTMDAQSKRLPYALKGSDAIFYSVFRYLGCAVDVRPVIHYNYVEEQEEEWNLNLGDLSDDDNDIPHWAEDKEPSRVGVGLPNLKVTGMMSGDGLTTKSVSDDAYLNAFQI